MPDRLRGAYYNKRDKRWIARLRVDGKLKTVGRFKTEKEAHDCYIAALKKYGFSDKYSTLIVRGE